MPLPDNYRGSPTAVGNGVEESAGSVGGAVGEDAKGGLLRRGHKKSPRLGRGLGDPNEDCQELVLIIPAVRFP